MSTHTRSSSSLSTSVKTHTGKDLTLPTGLFINNEFVPSLSGKTFATVDPSTGEPIAEVAEADKEDVDRAVDAAEEALKGWQMLPAATRGKLLWTLSDLIDKHTDSLAALESLDNGKPLRDAIDDVRGVADVFRYYAGWADKIGGQVLDYDPALHAYTRVEPVGVVGQIIPWNYPLPMLAWKVAPALACGNTVVLKTSEKTPLSALKLCSLLPLASIPPGVVNILSGGASTGSHIALHPRIRKIAFTGSTAVGRKIMKMAADSNLKKVTLELGGKSPNIVFDDADLDGAVAACFGGVYDNVGQNCCAGSRIFVQSGVYEEFTRRFVEKLSQTVVGPPTDPTTTHGPVIDSLQLSSITSFISLGQTHGATLAYGGTRLGTRGYFIQPTLFTNVTPEMQIYTQEIFGPVACLVRFETEEEVLGMANGTEYGLAAAVHTTDLDRATRMARGVQAGVVWVNCYNLTPPQMPFGGYKQSGIGRELGEAAIREYTREFCVSHIPLAARRYFFKTDFMGFDGLIETKSVIMRMRV
ncbi:aldehyde dehydrogenase [Fimicolochytrium jonesii]|uniref:aldehyde dehydrogenase n=1 Tax=Fimicolochytrium jonesii TaxID=1396493 RepID=UPI0022FF25C6|nr:aldehyde dehydrogenase [Fimicolochytrium jonesii]KAI8816511.1 aldehyde dehydrogenase [Fimicolochytrium jonesii]